MHKAKHRFIEIMRVELEDLHDDIEALTEQCGKAWHEHRLTDLGYCGNLAVLKNELRGVGLFNRILNAIEPESYDSLEDMVEDMENTLLSEIQAFGMVPAIDLLIRRKIDKVMKYVQARCARRK